MRKVLTCFIHGFYNQVVECGWGVNESYFSDREEVSNQDFLGIVLDYDENTKTLTLEQRNYFKLGDTVEFIGPNIEPITYTIKSIIDEEENAIDIARHPKMIVKLPFDKNIPEYSMMRIKAIDRKDVL